MIYLHFLDNFCATDLTTNDCESNWLNFEYMLTATNDMNIRKILRKSNNHLPQYLPKNEAQENYTTRLNAYNPRTHGPSIVKR